MNPLLLLEVAAASATGAAARFVVDGLIRAHRSTTSRWAALPLGTPLVNLTGSLLLGVLTGLVLFRGAPRAWQIIAGTGFCGGYTTFSTAVFETIRLAQDHRHRVAALNAVGTLAGTMVAAAIGLALASL